MKEPYAKVIILSVLLVTALFVSFLISPRAYLVLYMSMMIWGIGSFLGRILLKKESIGHKRIERATPEIAEKENADT